VSALEADDPIELDDWQPAYDDAPPPLEPANKAQALADVDRHLRYIAAIERHKAVDREIAATRQAELDRWYDRRMTRWEAKLAWHRGPCVELLAALREADPRLRTLDLPSGKVKSRTATKPTVVVADERAVLLWASHALPEAVVTRTRIDQRALAAHVLATGEIPEGVQLEEPRTSYTIDVAPDVEQ
jgi:phage host-nuclease inhibitor protein Gam